MLTSLFTFLLICIRLCVQKTAKELVKVLAFSCVIFNETYCLSKTQNFWVAKARTFFVKFARCAKSIQYIRLIFISRVNRTIQNWFTCSSIRNWIAYANEAHIVNKDSPIKCWIGHFGLAENFPFSKNVTIVFFVSWTGAVYDHTDSYNLCLARHWLWIQSDVALGFVVVLHHLDLVLCKLLHACLSRQRQKIGVNEAQVLFSNVKPIIENMNKKWTVGRGYFRFKVTGTMVELGIFWGGVGVKKFFPAILLRRKFRQVYFRCLDLGTIFRGYFQ